MAAGLSLTRIDATRRYQEVARQIVGLIESGEVARGGRLPAERDLAVSLGVSRATVREAMIALEITGRVAIKTGSGVFVAAQQPGLDFADVVADVGAGPLELLEARAMIEPTLAARAAAAVAAGPAAALGATLDDALRAMDAARDAAAHHDADHRFHQAVAQAAGNSVAASIVDALWREMFSPLFDRMRTLSGLLPFADPGAAQDHRFIAEAVAAGDAAASEAAMRRHLARVRAKLLQPDAQEVVDAAE